MHLLQTETPRLTPINRLERGVNVSSATAVNITERTSERIGRRAEALSARLRAAGERAFPPTAEKFLRSFSSGEVAQIVGVSDGYLRQLSLDGLGPSPELSSGGRRSYTLAQVNELRTYLAGARPKEARKFWPRRRPGDKLQVITVANFKGGSAKTTTSLYLVQGLALKGYRVLAIDLDPQASLSTMFGYQPEFDVQENATLFGAIRYDEERVAMKDIVKPTYFSGVSIVPGNLELMEFEHQTPKHIMATKGRPEDLFFRRVARAISDIDDDFDVVVIDCPPQLGFLTMGALNAATGMIVTIHPQMVDVASMSQFLLMTSELLSVIEDAGGELDYDFLKFLVTRHDPRDIPEQEIVALLRDLFGKDVFASTAWKSTAIANAGLTKQSLFELTRGSVGRTVYERAMESINAVNEEAIDLINRVWGR